VSNNGTIENFIRTFLSTQLLNWLIATLSSYYAAPGPQILTGHPARGIPGGKREHCDHIFDCADTIGRQKACAIVMVIKLTHAL
jgi:hypothetical protein